MNQILVLEDEDSLNRGISFTLQREGYQVLSCRSVKEAVEVFHKSQPQLILCDINLPDDNGLNFIKKIRKESNVHIICLTALDQEMDQVMGYEAGADDYITKPFSLSVLVLKVGAFFKKQTKENIQVLRSGEIVFYYGEMKVLIHDREIAFTKNEWKMLQLFMEHPKQILSKSQLLELLFDIDSRFVDENTLAVNVRRLREKIELDASKPEYIKNVRGIGYIWDKECVKAEQGRCHATE